jgi:hypothetical protein
MCTIDKNENDSFIPQAKILRVMHLMQDLIQRSYTPRQMADILGTSDRTVYRYLHLIQALGVAVDSTDNYYFIAQDDCPFCHGIVKGDGGDFAKPVSLPPESDRLLNP